MDMFWVGLAVGTVIGVVVTIVSLALCKAGED